MWILYTSYNSEFLNFVILENLIINTSTMKTSRRSFLKQTACGSCMMLGGSTMLFLESCSSTSNVLTYETSIFSIPKSEFASTPNLVVKHKKAGRIMVKQISDSEYKSISLVCTHMKGKVNEDGDGLKCSLHGSTFDKDGKRLAGKAEKDLTTYQTSVDGDNVVVKVA